MAQPKSQLSTKGFTGIRCLECCTVATEHADGWKAYIVGGYEGESLEVIIYCPACSLREFGDAA